MYLYRVRGFEVSLTNRFLVVFYYIDPNQQGVIHYLSVDANSLHLSLHSLGKVYPSPSQSCYSQLEDDFFSVEGNANSADISQPLGTW